MVFLARSLPKISVIAGLVWEGYFESLSPSCARYVSRLGEPLARTLALLRAYSRVMPDSVSSLIDARFKGKVMVLICVSSNS